MKTKVCKTCKKEKVLEDFYIDIAMKDGRDSECKSCILIKQNTYNKEHKKEIKEHNRIYDKTHKKEIKLYNETHKKEAKLYYQTHIKEIKVRNKLYRKTHKKEALEWERTNRDKARAHSAKKEALKRNAPGHFTSQEWTDLCNKYGNICLRCRKKKN